MFESAESRYNQWVHDHYRFLLRSAWALTGSRALAEDVVQDCFTSAWSHRTQLRDPGLARAWLFRIMRRSASRHLASGGAMQAAKEEDDEPGAQANQDDRLDIVKALARLTPIHREALVLYYFDDMPIAQMAAALEVAPGTVLSRLSRAREALKEEMTSPPRPRTATVTVLRKV